MIDRSRSCNLQHRYQEISKSPVMSHAMISLFRNTHRSLYGYLEILFSKLSTKTARLYRQMCILTTASQIKYHFEKNINSFVWIAWI